VTNFLKPKIGVKIFWFANLLLWLLGWLALAGKQKEGRNKGCCLSKEKSGFFRFFCEGPGFQDVE